MKQYWIPLMRINVISRGVTFSCDLDLDNVLSTWIEYEGDKAKYIVALYGDNQTLEVEEATYYDVQRALNSEECIDI